MKQPTTNRSVRVAAGNTWAACVAIGLIACASASLVVAQAADKVADARQKNAALLRQYNWSCRTELVRDEKVADIRIDTVTFGPDGRVQRTALNDEPSGRVPRRFIRHAIAEERRKEQDKYVSGLQALLDQYTLPTAGKLSDFLAHAAAQPITSADGKALLQITGAGVVVPGDTVTLTLDAATMQPRRAEVSTTYDGDRATLTATFATLQQTGLNYPQYAEAAVPGKNVTLQVHNFDFVRNE